MTAAATLPSDQAYTTGPWSIVSKNPNVSPTAGVDWDAWEKQHAPPTVYDPPQLKLDYYTGALFRLNHCCSVCSSRSPWCRLCVACCVPTCCVPGTKLIDLRDPEAFYADLLHDEHPSTPEHLKGVFWFQDNVTAPEQIFTLSDAYWRGASSALKAQRHNWTRDATCFGAIFHCLSAREPSDPENGNIRLELSPSGRWIWMTADQLIYIVQPGDDIRDGAGQPMGLPAGQLMRLTYKDADPSRPLAYQYRMTRVAYRRPDDGTIVRTPAHDLFEQQLRAKPHYRCGCCGVGLCLNDAEFLSAIVELSPWQIYLPKPDGVFGGTPVTQSMKR